MAEKIAAANDAQKLYKVVCCGNVKWRCAVGGGRWVVVGVWWSLRGQCVRHRELNEIEIDSGHFTSEPNKKERRS